MFVNTLDNSFNTLFRNDYSLNDLPEFKNAQRDDFSSVEPDDWLILSNAILIKYFDGKIPNPDSRNNADELVLNEVKSLKSKIELSLNEFKFREAIKNLMNIARVGNKHLAETEPWKIKESDPERVEQILKTSYIIITYLSVLSEPFIPFTSYKLMKMIGLNNFSWDMLDNISENIDYSFKIDKIEMLFRKIEDSEIDLQINKLNVNPNL